jgi:hypothetical protein
VLDSAARRIADLPAEARVLDVGGWAAPMARADAVIDIFPYETRGLYGPPVDPAAERFSASTWTQRDICATPPWPYADDEFDFVVCSHTLEDVRDPVRVCEELVRVARAGYVEVPAPVHELTFGLHGPWVGWSHHHWITELHDGALRFTFKPHLLVDAGRHLPAGSCDDLAPEELVLQLWWETSFGFEEQVLVGAEELDGWLGRLLGSVGPAPSGPTRRGLRDRLRRRG